MRTYDASTSIEASSAVVWKLLANVQQWPTWTPTVEKVEPLAGTELALGRKFKVFQPKLRPAVWTVTAHELGKGFVWESRALGLLMIASHAVHILAPGKTELRLTFSFQGPVGAVVARFYRSLVETYLHTEASSLKRHAESSRQGVSSAA